MTAHPPPYRRVVVTGLGAITSLGPTAETTWAALLAGQCGIRRADNLDPAQNPSMVRGDVPDAYVPSRLLEGKVARNTSRFSRMLVEATGDALRDAALVDDAFAPLADLAPAGVVVGTCGGGTHDDFLPAFETFQTRGASRTPPHLHVMFPHNLGAYTVHWRFGMGGPSLTLTTACATGAQAIGEAFIRVRSGEAPVMVAGSVESTQHPFFIAGFSAMRALVTDSNDHPERASRPFDQTRAGFALGEGTAVLILEDLEHARARGARVYAEILGFASSNDAYHPIAPHPEGVGAARAITAALADADVEPDQIDHVNAHAASTPAGDLAESLAIRKALGERGTTIPVTSIKGAIGHAMGASGAIETMAAVCTVHEQRIPPTLNYRHPDPEIPLDVVHGTPREATIGIMTKHSFGLGGQNACLVIGRAPGSD